MTPSTRALSLALALALVPNVASSARAQAPGSALAALATLKAAFNRHDDAAVQALFTPDAVVFDEVTPYRWTGANAARRWLHDDDIVIAKNGVEDAAITIGKPTFVHRGATSAYTVSPIVDSYVVAGRKQRETGLLTVIFVERGGTWKISLLGFAKGSDTSDASWL